MNCPNCRFSPLPEDAEACPQCGFRIADAGAALRSGGIDISGATVAAQGDIVGRDKIIGYTAEQVRVLIADLRTSFQPKPFDGRSPYVGLASFQEQTADRFFGREKLTQELIARVETSRFVVIAGPSGSGKSSLARAGLLPALKRGELAGSEHWLYEILTPGRHPLAELGRAVASLTARLSSDDEIQKNGRTDTTRLHRWAEVALGDQRTRRVILLVDQFEESFTQVSDETERKAFFNLLTHAGTVENGRVTIVCCTRSDFIGNWAAYPDLNAKLAHGLNQIPPMQEEELVSAIARPALQVGLQIDSELVTQILDDMRDAPGALPLMQFALDDLFQYEKSKGGLIALTRDGYLERGGLQKALARHADAEFANLSAEEQQIARSVFAGLIEPGRGTVDTKRTASFQELVPAGSDPAQVLRTVTKLANARLITTDEVNNRETVTLAHERLIDAWAWLRRLVDENREAIALQNQIREDAQEWEQHGRDASYIYTGARLATAREKLGGKELGLSKLALEFVGAAIAADELTRRRTRMRFITILAGLAIFGVFSWVFYIYSARQDTLRPSFQATETAAANELAEVVAAATGASIQKDARNTAEASAKEERDHVVSLITTAVAARKTQTVLADTTRSLRLAWASLKELGKAPDRALMIAIAANEYEPTRESQEALRQILQSPKWQLTLNGDEDTNELLILAKSLTNRDLTCEERVELLQEEIDCTTDATTTRVTDTATPQP